MAIGPPLVEEEEEEEEMRGMLGKGSYSEPDLSRICDDEDGECGECEADSGLQGDPGGGGGLLTRQRTWHHSNGGGGGGGREAVVAAAPGRLPVIKEVTSFV